MLRLISLTLEDFGPFKGRQTIDFPTDGVVIIYGDNGRGKTNLLNALRFALFGTILGRSGKAEDLAGFVNREALAEGRVGFSVTLALESDGTSYQLTRYLSDATAPPATRQEPNMTLTRSGIGLGPQEARAELGRLLPEQISRFFLFDGELLQQYEELLLDNSDIGDRIKESIERILGIPVLQNARTDVGALLSEANRAVGRAAEGDQRTRQIGLSLQSTQDELDAHVTTSDELRKRITELETDRETLEAQLAGTERTQRLFGERTQMRQAKARLEAALAEAQAQLQELNAVAWRAVVAPQLIEVLGQLDSEITAKSDRRNDALLASRLRAAHAAALASGKCPTCGHQVEAGALQPPPVAEDFEALEAELLRLHRRRDTLRAAIADDPSDRLRAAQMRVEDIQVELADLDTELEIVQEKLGSTEGAESALRHLAQQYAAVGEALSNARSSLEYEQAEIARRHETIEKLKAQLTRIDPNARAGAEQRAALLTQLVDLFSEGITRYRENLRIDVEREASAIFRELKQEPEFDGLRITESYGLEILHRDGSTIDRRSAGQEHIVALSLIAGLQRCAPIRGPIIMDSPFGRLDEHHTRNVVRSLPKMADQVVVLVYDTELDRQVAIQQLDGRLRSELQLERVNARHTSIEERTH